MMKVRIGLLILISLLFGSNICSQQVYFNKRYHLSESEAFSSATSVKEFNSNYFITGATRDTINQSRRWVFFSQLSGTGDVLLTRYIGNSINNYYPARSGSFILFNNNFYFVGNKEYYSNYNVAGLLLKLTITLDTIWSKEYIVDIEHPVDSLYHFNNVSSCNDNGFIITGQLFKYDQPTKHLLLKVDSLGVMEWVKYFGTTGLNQSYSVIQTTDGGYAIGGFWYIPGSSEYTGDPIVIKTDSLGNKEWEKNLGGPHQDNSANLCLGADGSIIVGTLYADSMAGSPVHGDPFSRIHVVKLDNEGSIIWDNKYGESEHYNYLTNIRCADDGSIIACGTKPNTFPHWSGWLLKLSDDGDSLWYRLYDNLNGNQSQNQFKDVIPTSDNGFLACGYVFPMQPDTGTQDAWVIKLDSMGCDTPGCSTGVGIEYYQRPEAGDRNLYIFPNPASTAIIVRSSLLVARCSVFIYDLYGRKQDEIIIPAGHEQTRIDVSDYPAGVYVAVVKNDNGIVARGKFVKR